MYLVSLNCTLEKVKAIHFMLCIFTTTFFKKLVFEAQGEKGRGIKKSFKGLTCTAGQAGLGSHTEETHTVLSHGKPLEDFGHGRFRKCTESRGGKTVTDPNQFLLIFCSKSF